MQNPRIVYGIHSFTAVRRADGLPYGISKVLANGSLSISGERNDLYAGSNKSPWASEDANTTYEISLQYKQIEDWMFEVFLGASVTKTPTGAGTVTALAARKGAIIGTTGVASVAVKAGSEANLKYGKYLVVAASATTVNVYALSDIDFGRGVKKDFIDDSMKINSAALTITSATDTDFTDFGIKFVGGSGTIGMVTGDSAEFEVFSPHNGLSEIVIGSSDSVAPEFEALMVAQRRSNKEIFAVHCYKVKASGLPIGFTEKDYAQPEVSATALYDAEKNAVAKVMASKAV